MIQGISPNSEPKKPELQSVADNEGGKYSIFDNAPKDGTVSTEEQKTAYLENVNKDSRLVDLCKKLQINFEEFFRNFGAYFEKIETDGTETSASSANKEVEQRILTIKMEILNNISNKMNGTEKEPPSILTAEGFVSDECLDYIINKIVYMGLELDQELLFKIFDIYDYDLSGDDSVITTSELRDVGFNSQFMNHDFEGIIKDTHVLDFIVNMYATALKNKEE